MNEDKAHVTFCLLLHTVHFHYDEYCHFDGLLQSVCVSGVAHIETCRGKVIDDRSLNLAQFVLVIL